MTNSEELYRFCMFNSNPNIYYKIPQHKTKLRVLNCQILPTTVFSSALTTQLNATVSIYRQ